MAIRGVRKVETHEMLKLVLAERCFLVHDWFADEDTVKSISGAVPLFFSSAWAKSHTFTNMEAFFAGTKCHNSQWLLPFWHK